MKKVYCPSKRILENCLEVTRRLNEKEFCHDVVMHLKPTFSSEDIELCSHYDKTEEYYDFFDSFFVEWFEANKNNKLKVPEFVFKGTKETVKGYLQGLFSG